MALPNHTLDGYNTLRYLKFVRHNLNFYPLVLMLLDQRSANH
jgi:hypothetical protein